MGIMASLTHATVRPASSQLTSTLGMNFIGLAIPRPGVVTEMIKEVQEFGLILREA
jgi:hypothetical protein